MNQTEIEVLTFSSFSPQWIILPHAWGVYTQLWRGFLSGEMLGSHNMLLQ